MEDITELFASNFTLSAAEEEIVVEKVKTGSRSIRHLLVGQALTLRPISREGLLRVFKPLWKDEGLRVGGLGGGKIIFEVSSVEIKQMVLDGCPWNFDKFLLLIADANGKGQPEKIPMIFENFWIQIHGLDPEDLTKEIGEKVGDALGVYKETCLGEDGVCQTKYLRIRIGLDVGKPLRRLVKIRIDGQPLVFKLKYERLPCFCFICGMLDHRDTMCCKRNMAISLTQQHQFGAFMRAEEEGSALFSRNPQRFFEPLKTIWKMKAPEFDDSVAGIVRNREDFESEVIVSLKGTILGVVPMEIGDNNVPSLALEPVQKRRRLVEKERMSTENPEEHAYSVNAEAETKRHPRISVSLIPPPVLSSEWDVGGRKSTQQREHDKPFGVLILSEVDPGPTPNLSTPGLQKKTSTGLVETDLVEAHSFKKWKNRAREFGKSGVGPKSESSASLTANAIVLADHRQLTSGKSSSVEKDATSLYPPTRHGETPLCTATTHHETSTTSSSEMVQSPTSTKLGVISNQGGEKLGILNIHGGEKVTEPPMGVLSIHESENATESLLTDDPIQALLAGFSKGKIGNGKATKKSEKGFVIRKTPVAKKNNSAFTSSGRTLKSPSVMGPALTHHEP